MKLEDQRISEQNSYQSMDPEFLTFRHNNQNLIEPSGRSIFSQRIEYPQNGNSYFSYKSLDKYPNTEENREKFNSKAFKKQNLQRRNLKFDEDTYNGAEEILDKINKQKSLRNFRSNQKLYNNDHKLGASYLQSSVKKLKYEIINQEESYKGKNLQHQNQELKIKLARLIKNIKREQRRQIFYDKEISQLTTQLSEYEVSIAQQNQSIAELEEICDQNKEECDKIINSMISIRQKNEELTAYLNDLDDEMDSSQVSVQTIKQDSVRERALSSKLKEGICELNKIKSELGERLNRLSVEVENMYRFIKENQKLEMEIHNVLYK